MKSNYERRLIKIVSIATQLIARSEIIAVRRTLFVVVRKYVCFR